AVAATAQRREERLHDAGRLRRERARERAALLHHRAAEDRLALDAGTRLPSRSDLGALRGPADRGLHWIAAALERDRLAVDEDDVGRRRVERAGERRAGHEIAAAGTSRCLLRGCRRRN